MLRRCFQLPPKRNMVMIRYMPASIVPWVSGTLLILVSALPGLALDFSMKELVLWMLPLLAASCIASCYSPRHKLLAGLSYMILFPLILVVTECLHEIRTVIISDGWINGVESIIRFFCAYWAICCIPVLIGSLLGLGLSKFKVGAFGNPYLFGYFLVVSTTLITYQVGILFDIPLSLLITSAEIDLTHGMSFIFAFVLPVFIVVLASLFAVSYAASYHPWKRRPLAWLCYMVVFPVPAVLMSAAAYIFLSLCYAAVVYIFS